MITRKEVDDALESANAALENLSRPKRAQTAIALNLAFVLLERLRAGMKDGDFIQVG